MMLGVPNGGSWTPMQVLSGDESFGGVIPSLGAPLDDETTRQILAGFPGFMQLQAGLTDSKLGLDKLSTWKKIAEQDLDRGA